MKRILIILVLVCAVLKCLAQESTFGWNAEGTIFCTDSVYLHDYSMVLSGKNGHKFIFPKNTIKISRHNKRYWNNDSVIIYLDGFISWGLLDECVKHSYENFDPGHIEKSEYVSIFNAIWPWGWNSRPKCYFNTPYDGKDHLCESDSKPTFFRVFRVRGDFYNKITSCLDCDLWHIRFRKPKKFYTVYVPIR